MFVGRVALVSVAMGLAATTGMHRPAPSPQRFVIPLGAFPGFVQVRAGDPATLGGTVGEMARNAGYVAGYAAGYEPRHPGLRGAVLVTTAALIFATDADASDAVEHLVVTYPNHAPLPNRLRIGNEGYLCVKTVPGVGSYHVTTYLVFWRQGKVAALVTLTGIRGITATQAFALARGQASRVAHPPALPSAKPPGA